MPHGRWVYRNKPRWVLKVVINLLCSSSSNWWYAWDKSSLVKYLDWLRLRLMSSTVGIKWRTLWMAWLAILISKGTHSPTVRSLLGTTTTGEIHGVGWFSGTLSMMPPFSSSSMASFTLSLTWKGILLCGCAMGITLSSMLSFTPSILIHQFSHTSKASGNLLTRSQAFLSLILCVFYFCSVILFKLNATRPSSWG